MDLLDAILLALEIWEEQPVRKSFAIYRKKGGFGIIKTQPEGGEMNGSAHRDYRSQSGQGIIKEIVCCLEDRKRKEVNKLSRIIASPIDLKRILDIIVKR